MSDPTARAISTVGIWISVAIVLAFGLCKMNWGDGTMFIIVMAMICGAATLSTALVWARRQQKTSGLIAPGNADRPSA